MQGLRGCCLANMMAQEQLTGGQVIDNVIAAAFGNASAGPTAAKAFQHLAAGDSQRGVRNGHWYTSNIVILVLAHVEKEAAWCPASL